MSNVQPVVSIDGCWLASPTPLICHWLRNCISVWWLKNRSISSTITSKTRITFRCSLVPLPILEVTRQLPWPGAEIHPHPFPCSMARTGAKRDRNGSWSDFRVETHYVDSILTTSYIQSPSRTSLLFPSRNTLDGRRPRLRRWSLLLFQFLFSFQKFQFVNV